MANKLHLESNGIVTFGSDNITLTHVADTGIKLKNTHTNGNGGVGCVLTLQTGDTGVTVNNVLGQIDFQAPDEGTGTDAILVAASIAAVSEGNFSAESNATKLSFKTGSSEAATEKMSLSSGGNLTISGTLNCGAISSSNNLDVTGDTSVSTLDSTGATSLATGGGAVNIASTGVMTTVKGTLNVDEAVTLDSTLDVTGDTSVSTLDSTGATSLATGGGAVNIASTGVMTTVKGTLNVDEAVTLDSTLDVTGITTLTSLSVDDINVNGKVITMTGSSNDTATITVAENGALTVLTTDSSGAAANIVITADGTVDINSAGELTLDSGGAINLEPAAGSVILLDGTISVDGGVITGVSSITSTTFTGNLTGNVTGNCSGTAATVTGAAQSNITSLGTLTTLTIDNIIINGTEIGHTSDTDLITLASDVVSIAGEITSTGNIKTDSSIKLKEMANAPSDTAAYGQLWVKTATPNELYFTTDAGNDIQITSGTSIASGGGSSAADDITAGDAAVNITTSSGNITIDAAANDSDIIFKGTDATADITMLTLDGSDAGTAIFNHDIKIADDGQIGSASAADAMIISSAGIVTFKDDILIKDGGTIGSASDADAITIAANGQLTLTQTLIGTALDISGDIDVDGTTNLDVVDIDGAVDMASTLQVDGAITSSDGMIITTADNTAQLILKSTDADSGSGPRFELTRDSGSPVNADNIGLIVWKADDDGGTSTEVIQMIGVVADVTDGSEYGTLDVRTMVAGNTRSRAFYGVTETVFNDGGADLNFRIEGDSLVNLFVCDAGQEAIAMGDANPTRHGKTTRLLCYQGSGTGTDFALHVGRVGTGAESQVCFSNGYGEVGSIKTNGTSTSFNTSSDYRLKENVVDMTGAMDRVNKLLPRRFNFKVDTDTTLDGFVAHEVAEVVPEAISGEKDGVNGDGSINPQGIDQAKLVPLLTGALKEAITKIESLEARIKAIEDA